MCVNQTDWLIQLLVGDELLNFLKYKRNSHMNDSFHKHPSSKHPLFRVSKWVWLCSHLQFAFFGLNQTGFIPFLKKKKNLKETWADNDLYTTRHLSTIIKATPTFGGKCFFEKHLFFWWLITHAALHCTGQLYLSSLVFMGSFKNIRGTSQIQALIKTIQDLSS